MTAVDTPVLFAPLAPDPTPDGRMVLVTFDMASKVAARGHIDQRLFVCLAVAHLAQERGRPEALDVLDGAGDLAELVDDVTHMWAIEHTGPDGTDPAWHWLQVTPNAPGAFPITVLFTE